MHFESATYDKAFRTASTGNSRRLDYQGELAMSKKDSWKTAAELDAELAKDAEFQRLAAEKAKRRQEREAAFTILERPILDDLTLCGYEAASIHQALRRYAPLPIGFVDVLLDWVSRSTDLRILETLIRALGAAHQPFDGRTLAKCFDENRDENLRWVILNTVAIAKPHSIEEWLAKVLQNPAWRKTLVELGYREDGK